MAPASGVVRRPKSELRRSLFLSASISDSTTPSGATPVLRQPLPSLSPSRGLAPQIKSLILIPNSKELGDICSDFSFSTRAATRLPPPTMVTAILLFLLAAGFGERRRRCGCAGCRLLLVVVAPVSVCYCRGLAMSLLPLLHFSTVEASCLDGGSIPTLITLSLKLLLGGVLGIYGWKCKSKG